MENETQPSSPSPKKGSSYLVPLAIVVAGAIVAGAVLYSGVFANTNAPAPTANAPAPTAAPSVDIKNVKTAGEPFVGDPNAPVTIAYWSDYQCPFCKQFETQTMSQIVDNYVKSGKVKIVFKDFSFLGPDSQAAAVFARGIWELYPKQYFAWREAMFNAQDKENAGFGDQASIVKLTESISGIDVQKVVDIVNKKTATYQKELNADRAEATQLGIRGTPGFVIGTNLVPGAMPYATFSKLIDAQLKA